MIEGVNARHLTAEDLGEDGAPESGFDFIVADLSFISLTLVLPALVPFLADKGEMLMLVKPQFELQPAQVGRHGLVKDPASYPEVEVRIRQACTDLGLKVMPTSTARSPVATATANFCPCQPRLMHFENGAQHNPTYRAFHDDPSPLTHQPGVLPAQDARGRGPSWPPLRQQLYPLGPEYCSVTYRRGRFSPRKTAPSRPFSPSSPRALTPRHTSRASAPAKTLRCARSSPQFKQRRHQAHRRPTR